MAKDGGNKGSFFGRVGGALTGTLKRGSKEDKKPEKENGSSTALTEEETIELTKLSTHAENIVLGTIDISHIKMDVNAQEKAVKLMTNHLREIFSKHPDSIDKLKGPDTNNQTNPLIGGPINKAFSKAIESGNFDEASFKTSLFNNIEELIQNYEGIPEPTYVELTPKQTEENQSLAMDALQGNSATQDPNSVDDKDDNYDELDPRIEGTMIPMSRVNDVVENSLNTLTRRKVKFNNSAKDDIKKATIGCISKLRESLDPHDFNQIVHTYKDGEPTSDFSKNFSENLSTALVANQKGSININIEQLKSNLDKLALALAQAFTSGEYVSLEDSAKATAYNIYTEPNQQDSDQAATNPLQHSEPVNGEDGYISISSAPPQESGYYKESGYYISRDDNTQQLAVNYMDTNGDLYHTNAEGYPYYHDETNAILLKDFDLDANKEAFAAKTAELQQLKGHAVEGDGGMLTPASTPTNIGQEANKHKAGTDSNTTWTDKISHSTTPDSGQVR